MILFWSLNNDFLHWAHTMLCVLKILPLCCFFLSVGGRAMKTLVFHVFSSLNTPWVSIIYIRHRETFILPQWWTSRWYQMTSWLYHLIEKSVLSNIQKYSVPNSEFKKMIHDFVSPAVLTIQTDDILRHSIPNEISVANNKCHIF